MRWFDWNVAATRRGKTSTEPPLLHPAGWQGPESNRLPVVSVVFPAFAGREGVCCWFGLRGSATRRGKTFQCSARLSYPESVSGAGFEPAAVGSQCSLPGIRGGEGGWSAGFSRLGFGRGRLKPALRKRNRDKEWDEPITALPLSYPAFAGAGIEPATNVIIQAFAEGGWSGMASSRRWDIWR